MAGIPAFYEPTSKQGHIHVSKQMSRRFHKVTEASLALGRMCAWSFLHMLASHPRSSLSISTMASLLLDSKPLCQVCDGEKGVFHPAKLSSQGRNGKCDSGSFTP